MKPDVTGLRGATASSLSDQEKVSFEHAKRLLLASLPSQTGADDEPLETSRLADQQVEMLVQIGAYAVDRWTAEARALATARPSARSDIVRKAVDDCTGLHFKTVIQRAHEDLRAYQDRHRQVMPATVVRKALSGLVTREHAYDDVRRWQWWVIEAFKGFWSFVGLTLFGGALVLAARLAFPGLPHLIVEGVRTLLEPGS